MDTPPSTRPPSLRREEWARTALSLVLQGFTTTQDSTMSPRKDHGVNVPGCSQELVLALVILEFHVDVLCLSASPVSDFKTRIFSMKVGDVAVPRFRRVDEVGRGARRCCCGCCACGVGCCHCWHFGGCGCHCWQVQDKITALSVLSPCLPLSSPFSPFLSLCLFGFRQDLFDQSPTASFFSRSLGCSRNSAPSSGVAHALSSIRIHHDLLHHVMCLLDTSFSSDNCSECSSSLFSSRRSSRVLLPSSSHSPCALLSSSRSPRALISSSHASVALCSPSHVLSSLLSQTHGHVSHRYTLDAAPRLPHSSSAPHLPHLIPPFTLLLFLVVPVVLCSLPPMSSLTSVFSFTSVPFSFAFPASLVHTFPALLPLEGTCRSTSFPLTFTTCSSEPVTCTFSCAS